MKVLYAEDERQLSVAVAEILKMEGFEVTAVYDGGQALDALEKDFFDAVILDIMMPVADGMEVLRRMRDRISGLTSGADDYLAKPFAMKELVARLNSLIRRNSDYRHSVVKFSNIELDSNTCELKSDKGSLRLNNTEAELLTFLIYNAGKYYSAEEINESVWNGKESPEKAELYVFYLKNKLRQIHSAAGILMDGDRYALGE